MAEDIHIPYKEYHHIKNLIDRLIKTFNELVSALFCLIKVKQKLHLFNPVLDEDELATCFHELYIDCTKGMRMPGQDEYDKVKFAAYLYYLIKLNGFKGENFNQSRFYDFIQKNVFTELEQKTLRTFNNRVNSLKILDNAEMSDKHTDVCYFQHLKDKFQNSSFFENLKRLRSIFPHFL